MTNQTLLGLALMDTVLFKKTWRKQKMKEGIVHKKGLEITMKGYN